MAVLNKMYVRKIVDELIAFDRDYRDFIREFKDMWGRYPTKKERDAAIEYFETGKL